MPDFTAEETEFLQEFESRVTRGEQRQYLDLVRNCTNKFQFAKTYRVYRKDLEKTEAMMRERIARGDLGPGIAPAVAEEMIRIGRDAVSGKLETCESYFIMKWGEPITNYAGTGRGCMGMLFAGLLILVAAACH